MIEYLPIKITSDIRGYELLLRIYNDLAICNGQEIKISFKNVEWLEANLVAVLGAIFEDLESRGNKVTLIDLDDYINKNDILYRNGFLQYYGCNMMMSKNNFTTQIPYRKFKEREDSLYNEYIQRELLDKKEFPSHSTKLGYEIKRNIFELFENARTHGSCKNIHTCGQFYPTRKKLHITIVDKGKTIVANVREHLGENKGASDCIEWAMEKGNTTKKGNTPGGLGLGLIFEFINLNKGKIQMISSNGYWELREGKIKKYDLNFSFDGTIANIEFDLSQNIHYSFKDEKTDLDIIF